MADHTPAAPASETREGRFTITHTVRYGHLRYPGPIRFDSTEVRIIHDTRTGRATLRGRVFPEPPVTAPLDALGPSVSSRRTASGLVFRVESGALPERVLDAVVLHTTIPLRKCPAFFRALNAATDGAPTLDDYLRVGAEHGGYVHRRGYYIRPRDFVTEAVRLLEAVKADPEVAEKLFLSGDLGSLKRRHRLDLSPFWQLLFR